METCLCHIGLILSTLNIVCATASKSDVSSSNKVTFGLKGMFYLFWKWEPSSANCSLRYDKEMRSLRNGWKPKDQSPASQWELEIQRGNTFDLNDRISLFVEAKCNQTTIDSWNRTVEIAPGDERTAVKNFQCVWHYQQHVKCIGQPGPSAPNNTNYRILYWINSKSSNANTDRHYALAEFSDLLETGKTCELYSSNDLKTVECQFLLNQSISDFVHIAMVVTDTSKSIKPYIYYEDAVRIVKLKPPKIEAYRTSNNSIHVSWNKSHDTADTEYELSLTSSNEEPKLYETNLNTQVHNGRPDVTYTVKVREKLARRWLSQTNGYTWSDWSQEKVLKAENDQSITSIILPLIMLIAVIIAAVFLLVHMKKLKALICPQIPDPARTFPKDLQQYLRNDVRIIYSKPEKEEICPVYLIESPLATKCV